MKLVVGTEAIFFLSLMVGFLYFAYYPGFQPQFVSQLDLPTTGVFTALLLSSSFTFWRAETAFKQEKPGRLKGWLLATIVLGAVFLGNQVREYGHLFNDQFVVSQGPFTTGFFTLTGFHGLHVLVGLITLSIVLYLAHLGDFTDPRSSVIRSVGIYWHFVDLVWMIVFTLVYLFPHFITIGGHAPTP